MSSNGLMLLLALHPLHPPRRSALFPPSSVNQFNTVATPIASSADTPAPQTTSSRKNKTPASASSNETVASNQKGCLNPFLFKEFRYKLVDTCASSDIITDDQKFNRYKTNFTNQANHRFKLKYQSMSVIQQQLDSQPRTRAERRAILESFDVEAAKLRIILCGVPFYPLLRDI